MQYILALFSIMLNFLITDICSLIPTDYFRYIVQFEDTMSAQIWFIENGYNTEQVPYYKESFECSPVDTSTAKALMIFAKNNNLNKFTLIESESYRILCFTEKERNRFTTERLEGSEQEKLEFTEVEPSFVFGFCNEE